MLTFFSADNVKTLPTPTLPALLSAALPAVLLLWIPFTVLPILDGLLFVATPLDVGRDIALLCVLGAVLSLALVGVARGAGLLARPLGASAVVVTSWSLLLLPLLAICARQGARMGWQWVRSVFGHDWQVAPLVKLAVSLVLVLLVIIALSRLGWVRGLASCIRLLVGLRATAIGLLLVAVILVAINPPSYRPMASRVSTVDGGSGGPDVILITVDTVAAQDADACNPASAFMPRLAAFAQGASCFERAYAASNFTTSAISTMETGLLPWSHHATQPDATMREGVRGHTLAEALRKAGWRTHFVTDNMLGSPRHRGSTTAYDTAWLSKTGLSANLYRNAASVFADTTLPRLTAASLAFLSAADGWVLGEKNPFQAEHVYDDMRWLERQEQNGKPQFVWGLTLPPHSPYLPPPSTRHKLLPPGELERVTDLLPDNIEYVESQQALVDKHRLRYRELMMAADMELGRYLDELRASGRLDRSIVIITSDHGESFEQGFYGHAGPRVHEALIRVPMVIRLPGQQETRRISMPVSHADIGPTVLDLLGLPAMVHAEGRSIRPALEGKALPTMPVFSMTMERQSRFRPLDQGMFAIIDGSEKLVMELPSGTSRLYDLVLDPMEAVDLSAERSTRAQQLRGLLQERLRRAESLRTARLSVTR